MTKKHEAVDKAKQSWKKTVEWWKQFWKWWIQIVWWTAWALWYALLSGWEKIVSKVSEARENGEWLNSAERKKRKDNAEKYSDRAKKHIAEAWHFGKKAALWTWETAKWWAKALWYGTKAGYHLIDAWDKAIWEQIEKKQLKKWKKVWKISSFFRDNILKLLIAAWVTGYGWYEWAKYYINQNQDWKEIIIDIKDEEWNSNEISLIPTGKYSLLNWKNITVNAPLTRWYLWWDLENSWTLTVGDTLTLNPAISLHNLWTKKIQKYGQFTNDISKLDSIDAAWMTPEEVEVFRFRYPIDATYLFVVRPYVDWKEIKNTMSIEQFIKKTNHIIENLKKDTETYDWWLTWAKKDLFDAIRKDINWESIVAYAMTELCENKENGEFNKQLFDILLKNSWVNYLSNIPAIYDGKTSYWLYQFTEFALYNHGWEKRGASVVNEVLDKDKQIPGSVIDLKTWQDQTKAAYMFALCNLNTAVNNLTDQQAKDLFAYQKSNREDFRDNMTQLIAMCHHMPVDAKALKKWHEDKYKLDIYKYGKAQTYGKASKNNYESLKK